MALVKLQAKERGAREALAEARSREAEQEEAMRHEEASRISVFATSEAPPIHNIFLTVSIYIPIGDRAHYNSTAQ